MNPTLLIGNKTYSSWSFRPWILLKQFEIAFQEIVTPLFVEGSKETILATTPSGKVPALVDDGLVVWDSLAICEYVADKFPDKAIWPRASKARARARSISAEMHSSFQALRSQCPMNLRRVPAPCALSIETLADIARVESIWTAAREDFGGAGPFLFGEFSAADAMYAPVVFRFSQYEAPVGPTSLAYMAAMQALPAWRQWVEEAAAEVWLLPQYDRD